MKVPAILFGIALIVRLAAIVFWQFDGLYGQDSFAYFQQALAIAYNLPKGLSPPGDFFWPNGYPSLIALFSLIVGKTPLAGQLVSLLTGALLSPLAYVLTKDLPASSHGSQPSANRIAGIIAGLIIAVAGQPILSSIVVMADIPALFWATLSTWLVVRASTQPDLRNAAWNSGFKAQQAVLFMMAGAVLALAIVSRWIYGLIVPGIALYILFNMRRSGRFWGSSLFAILGGTMILGPQLWLSLNKPEGLWHAFLMAWHPLNFFQREFETIEGYFFYQLPVGIFYAQPAGHPAYIFPFLGLASLWGFWRLWQDKHWGELLLLLGWIAPVYLFLSGIPYQNFRFGLTLYVPLVILTALGTNDWIWHRTPAHPFPPACTHLHPRLIILLTVGLSLLGMLGWAYPMLDSFLTTQNHDKEIARQIEQALPPQATLVTFGLTLTLQHYSQLEVKELYHLDEGSLGELLTTQKPSYLLLNLRNIDTQWLDKRPQINYRWLKENTSLAEMDSFPPYVLFKIEKISTNSAQSNNQ